MEQSLSRAPGDKLEMSLKDQHGVVCSSSRSKDKKKKKFHWSVLVRVEGSPVVTSWGSKGARTQAGRRRHLAGVVGEILQSGRAVREGKGRGAPSVSVLLAGELSSTAQPPL